MNKILKWMRYICYQLSQRWTGIHYYHPPKYTNKLLVIGIFGKRLHIKLVKDCK